jgi:hypothetical protein
MDRPQNPTEWYPALPCGVGPNAPLASLERPQPGSNQWQGDKDARNHRSEPATPGGPSSSAEPISGSLTFGERVRDFLAQQRVAVTGISNQRELTGNLIYRS